MTMTADDFRSLTKGHFFTVIFRKKDGSVRTLNGLDRVKAYLRGGKPVTDGRIITWDRQVFRENLIAGKDRRTAGSRAYRSFYPEQIIELKVGHKKYDADGEEIE
jgi:hypothetical protein